MINTIKVYQAKALIDQHNIDNLIYVDRVSDEDYMEIIFKKGSNNQLYSFYYYRYSDDPDLGLANNNRDLGVKVAPVKKVTKQITGTKYVREDSND